MKTPYFAKLGEYLKKDSTKPMALEVVEEK